MMELSESVVQRYSESNCRTSCSQMFFKIGVLKNIVIFTGKHPCWSLCFNKVAGLLQHTYFPVNIGEFCGTSFLQNTFSGCFCSCPYARRLQLFSKREPDPEFSCEFCEFFQNTFFHRPLLVAASKLLPKIDYAHGFCSE